MTQSFDYDQYRRDYESYRNPLQRAYLPEFEAVGTLVEVFALPGLEKDPGRYIFSQTNAAECVGKKGWRIPEFLESRKVKPLWAKGFEFPTFRIQGNNRPITSIQKRKAPGAVPGAFR
ncbi:MAG: hypothetical protein F6K53_20170 [Moorea sp. SIO4A1]|uniref:hypothetical protein n=1 Tax=Moorena sp. SIO4A1 TaxID=2607835 RepID=UPI001417AD8A|nr:hypothetical protein [Moorena sp. SIO4A1]NEO43282.1 hypothetical protein [Moorena sp. SIO4A3]NEQ59588.1 hypothetical protein [Moorena sp. SIO4A1]